MNVRREKEGKKLGKKKRASVGGKEMSRNL